MKIITSNSLLVWRAKSLATSVLPVPPRPVRMKVRRLGLRDVSILHGSKVASMADEISGRR
jgi:hypothetical protein